jgi:hypothetical protein
MLKKLFSLTLTTIMIMGMGTLAITRDSLLPSTSSSDTDTYGTSFNHPLDTGKEILYYLFWTQDKKLKADIVDLKNELSLSDAQLEELKNLGLDEHLINSDLNKTYSSNSETSINQFNACVDENTISRNNTVENILGEKYEHFRVWIADWWYNEREYRMN